MQSAIFQHFWELKINSFEYGFGLHILSHIQGNLFLLPVYTCGSVKMPKKKTGQRKKAEKQRERQREIRTQEKSLVEKPCNFLMVIFRIKITFFS